MATFEFCSTNNLGFSHCGCVYAEGYGTLELSDEEVALLVNLIRKNGTTDVDHLQLKKNFPELFKKLDDAFRETAREATIDHWYMEGFHEGCYEYDPEELMAYCEENYDFVFEYDEDDYIDEDGEVDEDSLLDDKYDSFTEWLGSTLEFMDTRERIRFMREHMNAEIDLTDLELDYCVEIPSGIIELANNELH